MTISRTGSLKNRGTSTIKLSKLRVSWDARLKQIHISSYGVRDFSTEATHDYTVSIPLDELGQIIKELGDRAPEDSPNDLEAYLSHTLKPMIRLVAALSGATVKQKNS